MSIVVWIVAAVVAFLVLKYLVQAITGLAVPRQISGPLLLRQEMKSHGLATDGLPQQFFDDCVRWSEGVASMEGNDWSKPDKPGGTAEFVESLQNLARMAALWVREPESNMFKAYGSAPNSYRELFEKYNLRAL